MTLHSVGWFVFCAWMLVDSVLAGYQELYIASGCFFLAAIIAGVFCVQTAEPDETR